MVSAVRASSLGIQGSVFEKNTAGTGGAVSVFFNSMGDVLSLNISDTRFTSNKATSLAQGAGVSTQSISWLHSLAACPAFNAWSLGRFDASFLFFICIFQFCDIHYIHTSCVIKTLGVDG